MSPIPRDHISLHPLTLRSPTLNEFLDVVAWRRTCPEALRTSHEISYVEQDRFYREVVCGPCPPHRFYAAHIPCNDPPGCDCRGAFVALASLEHISWENGHAEIGLIVDPARHGQGIGRAVVALVLREAFLRLRLETVWGEAYLCGRPMFWERIVRAYGGTSTIWPRRKFWDGALHDAMLFTITREGWGQAEGREEEAEARPRVDEDDERGGRR